MPCTQLRGNIGLNSLVLSLINKLMKGIIADGPIFSGEVISLVNLPMTYSHFACQKIQL